MKREKRKTSSCVIHFSSADDCLLLPLSLSYSAGVGAGDGKTIFEFWAGGNDVAIPFN